MSSVYASYLENLSVPLASNGDNENMKSSTFFDRCYKILNIGIFGKKLKPFPFKP